MSRYLLTCIGTRGDVQPFVAIAQGLRNNNPEAAITLAAHEEYEKFVISYGFGFSPLRPSITDVLQSPEAKAANNTWFFQRGKKMAEFMGPVFTSYLNDIQSAIATLSPTHLVLSTQAIGCGALLIAESHPTIKISILHVIPFVPTSVYAPALIAGGSMSLGMPFLNTLAWSMMMTMMGSMTARLENPARAKVGLQPATDFYPQTTRRHNIQIIHAYSKYLLPRPFDWPANAHVVGPLVVDEKHESPLASDLNEWITHCRNKSKDSIVVYFGIGSMLGSLFDHAFAKQALNHILRASQQVITADPRVNIIIHTVLNASQSIDLEFDTTVYGSYIFCLTKPAPHTTLFQKIDLVIHHGGAGTTHAALLAGCPSIVLPCGLESDQPFWANVIVNMQFGTRGFEMKGITPVKFKAALELAVKELPITKAKCKEFKEKADTEDAVGECIRIIG
ncbi:hypothetical protein BDR26DRAFT_875295 [Obelidium mucronatum]|nr:hypothetical protein BDR26DRAFT_875295 [Obelidium mucronatum]